jgi:hypothetical protein
MHDFRNAAKAAVAPAKLLNRTVEVRGTEVRPETRGKIQLGVSNLPERAIAQALLAAVR